MKLSKILSTTVALGALTFAASSFAVSTFSLDVNQAGYAGTTDGITTEIGTFVNTADIYPLVSTSVLTTNTLLDGAGQALSGPTYSTSGDDIEGFGDFWSLSWTLNGLTVGDTITVDFLSANPNVQVATLSILSLSYNAGDVVGINAEFATVLNGFWAFDGVVSNGNFVDPIPTISIDSSGISIDITAVPEPSIIALLGLGLVGMGVATRRKQKAA